MHTLVSNLKLAGPISKLSANVLLYKQKTDVIGHDQEITHHPIANILRQDQSIKKKKRDNKNL